MVNVISEEPKVDIITKSKMEKKQADTRILRIPNKHHQQALSKVRLGNHLPPEEPRTGIVSSLETHSATAATHILESQEQALSAGLKHTKPQQPLTNWRAKNRHCQQACNTSSHSSHLHPGEPRTGIVSRLESYKGTVRHENHPHTREQSTA